MTDNRIDLHVHTTASDGTTTPSQTVSLAAQCGLRAIAITDHDTISGFGEADAAGRELGVEIIPGIEFSTKYKKAVHILGYCIDTNNADLLNTLDGIVRDRDERNRKVVQIMQNDGIDISYEYMLERFGDVVGRPHFAQILVEHGMATSINDAFKRLVGKHMRYWQPRTTVPLDKCIELILNAGGVAAIAHPFEYKYDKDDLKDLIRYCMDRGVKAIEVRHPSHTKAQIELLESIIRDNNVPLLMTGGSDFHGDVKPNNHLGEPEVPYLWLEALKENVNCK